MMMTTKTHTPGLNQSKGFGLFPGASLAFLFCLLFSAGCAGTNGTSPLLRTSLGPSLEGMWEAHGGLSSWRKFSGATFQYRAVIQDEIILLPQVLIDFRAPGSAWYRHGPDGPWEHHTISLSSQDGATPAGLRQDLALGSLPDLFHLPFTLSGNHWTFRRSIHAASISKQVEFEATRKEAASGIGPFFIRDNMKDSNSRGLQSAHYLCRHPGLQKGAYRVDFGDYIEREGILISTRREHYFLRPQLEAFSRTEKVRSIPAWTESLGDVHFLTEMEVDEATGKSGQKVDKG